MQSLIEIIQSWKEYTVITGNRRRYPPRLPSDILLPVAWTDFALLDYLPNPKMRKIVHDGYFAQDWLEKYKERNVFTNSLISCGAPDVNFASLSLNNLSLFRFIIDYKAQDELIDLFERLSKMSSENLTTYLIEHQKLLDSIVARLCPYAIFDLFAPNYQRTHELARYEHGLISLAEHPYGLSKFCILAGGITGPTTAASFKLLGGCRIFDPQQKCLSGLETRPLGGIFRRKNATRQPPDDIFHIEKDLEWVTPPYSINDLIKMLKAMRETSNLSSLHLTRNDVDRLISLTGSVRETSKSPKLQTLSKVHVLILTGGLGSRMRKYTKGKISKLELPLIFKAPGKNKSRTETVLGTLVQALAETRLVEDILLVTNNKYYESQKKLVEEFATRYNIKVEIDTEKMEDEGNIVKILSTQFEKYKTSTIPIAIMMGDTLFAPNDLKRLFRWIGQKKPPMALACSHSEEGDISKYGAVEIDGAGKVLKIREKPGAAIVRIISQGIYVFSQELNIGQLLQRSNTSTLVDFLNKICERIPLHSFILSGPIFDCGTERGYETARKKSKQGKLW